MKMILMTRTSTLPTTARKISTASNPRLLQMRRSRSLLWMTTTKMKMWISWGKSRGKRVTNQAKWQWTISSKRTMRRGSRSNSRKKNKRQPQRVKNSNINQRAVEEEVHKILPSLITEIKEVEVREVVQGTHNRREVDRTKEINRVKEVVTTREGAEPVTEVRIEVAEAVIIIEEVVAGAVKTRLVAVEAVVTAITTNDKITTVTTITLQTIP